MLQGRFSSQGHRSLPPHSFLSAEYECLLILFNAAAALIRPLHMIKYYANLPDLSMTFLPVPDVPQIGNRNPFPYYKASDKTFSGSADSLLSPSLLPFHLLPQPWPLSGREGVTGGLSASALRRGPSLKELRFLFRLSLYPLDGPGSRDLKAISCEGRRQPSSRRNGVTLHAPDRKSVV